MWKKKTRGRKPLPDNTEKTKGRVEKGDRGCTNGDYDKRSGTSSR